MCIRDSQEEDFIDATLFRAVEWFDIRAFEPWLSTGAAEFSSLVQHGIDHTQDGWDFFHWCRSVSYTHLRAHETVLDLVCRLLLEKKKQKKITKQYDIIY